MNRWVCLPLFLLSCTLYGQRNLQLGLNVTPLVMNTVELRGEVGLNRHVSLEAGAGFRSHTRDQAVIIRIQALQGYVQERNQAAFVSLGGRLFNAEDNPYEVPFIGLNVSFGYFKDEILATDRIPPTTETQILEGFQFGASANIGFSIRVSRQLHLDLAMQMGYSPPRKDILQYYIPGLGYSTYGPGVIGIRGGHLQPLLILKYMAIKDKRQRIWEME